MKKNVYSFVTLTIFLLTIVSCNTASPAKDEATAKQINTGYDTLKLGKETFEEKCVVCHGSDGRLGASGAKILPDTKLTLEEVKQQVMNGKKAMPSFKQILTDGQVTAVAKYALTLKK